MNFFEGEVVSVLHEIGQFTIVSIGNHFAFVKDGEGFEYKIDKKLLVKRNPILGDVYIKDQPIIHVNKIKSEINLPSIDLHAEALDLENLHPSEILHVQIERCKQFLNQAISKRNKKVLIIHGIGEGKLKSTLRILLQGKKGITYHDGNYSHRGTGSTLVEIRLSEVTPF